MNPDKEKWCCSHKAVKEPMLTINESPKAEMPDIFSQKMPLVVTSNQNANFLIAKSTMGGYNLTNLETGVCLHLANESTVEYLKVGEFYARRA